MEKYSYLKRLSVSVKSEIYLLQLDPYTVKQNVFKSELPVFQAQRFKRILLKTESFKNVNDNNKVLSQLEKFLLSPLQFCDRLLARHFLNFVPLPLIFYQRTLALSTDFPCETEARI